MRKNMRRNENKKVIIRRYDGIYCLVLVRKNSTNPAHWIFTFSELPYARGIIRVKRYSSGNYYLVDTFFGGVSRIRIKQWFPAWDLPKILAAHENEVFR